jgi:hypothetical protein
MRFWNRATLASGYQPCAREMRQPATRSQPTSCRKNGAPLQSQHRQEQRDSDSLRPPNAPYQVPYHPPVLFIDAGILQHGASGGKSFRPQFRD